MEHAGRLTQASAEKPIPGLATLAASGMFFSLSAALYNFVYIPSQHPRGLGGLAYLGPLLLFTSVSALLSVVVALWTLVATITSGDKIASWAFGFFLLAVLFAVYTLVQNGNPSYPAIFAIYGFPDGDLWAHPVAFYGSLAMIAATAPVAFAYALTRGQARRVSAVAGLPLTLAIWIAIRIAG